MPARTLRLYDTALRREEEIVPSDGRTVRLYTCGPTVYAFAHLGNFRTFLFEDLLRRTLLALGLSVHQVMNLTDVDDKTIKGSIEKGVSLAEYTKPFKEAFFQDLAALRIQKAEDYPEATTCIPEMIEMIRVLERKGFTYRDPDGSLYFSISKAAGYGKLGHLDLSSLRPGASGRTNRDDYTADGISDFVLWKAHEAARDGQVFWDSPWGKGRPGWHLECSVMAKTRLGDTIDLHAGGVDLIFPHHENEIAQSEAANDTPFALHWAHAEHLLVDGKKMSKSLGNFYTLRDVLGMGYLPSTIRYFLMGTHYRTQLNFTFQALEAAATSVKRIRDFAERIAMASCEPSQSLSTAADAAEMLVRFEETFFSSLASDLNINEALAALFECIRYSNALLDAKKLCPRGAAKVRQFLAKVDAVLDIMEAEPASKPDADVEHLLHQRQEARKNKDWAKSDLLRQAIREKGFLVEDVAGSQKVTRAGQIHVAKKNNP